MFEDIDFTNNPKHGIVREVRNLIGDGASSLISLFSNEVKSLIDEDKEFDINDALAYVMKEHPDEFLEFSRKEEDNNLIAVISLATNKIWRIEELDEMAYDEVEALYDKSLEMIGGDVNRFFKNSRLNQQPKVEQKQTKSAGRKKS